MLCVRFEKRIYIPLPDYDARCEMFRIHIGDTAGVTLSTDEFGRLAEITDGCVADDFDDSVWCLSWFGGSWLWPWL